ncbi:hypothetical protein BU23DRAFT_550563 [Bimuria novae-zelandiae CBS 107.79]|uniref:GAR domain-containing protein n=1 Tax=Bimuria novae-zelandiae CBS 107.79 TaxID=1447943 RepID=A0A6A5VMV0_9PLEO|nr:hypothetical protein BU23DRAFT_550563 [Bimuria novae-zelandiae CBS 107.79]
MLSSPPRLLAPISPYRPPSPTMSPGSRRGRTLGSSDESHLRDLSPGTTLRAFTQRPMPYDVSQDEYKIFACIENLTPAERDLGARVAKAAQRLKDWCDEIGQWGWSGSFEQPSEEYKESRRKSLQMRIEEHMQRTPDSDDLPPLEYWGSLLSVEVQAHEARLDEISDELITLDVEELKGHVLDMHPGSRSRPLSAGFGANRTMYKPMDDFSFLITQTLISALPHHCRVKERLQAWTARVTVLREAPRYLDDLKTAQKAMRLGWEALGPPKDPSDTAFETWKKTVDTIAGVMQDRVSDLGRRLDKMLDTLEGHEDCLPDRWIDVFEGVEGDFGRWTQESRRKIIEFDVRRHADTGGEFLKGGEPPVTHSDDVAPNLQGSKKSPASAADDGIATTKTGDEVKSDIVHGILPDSALDGTPKVVETEQHNSDDESVFEEGDTVIHHQLEEEPADAVQSSFEAPSPVKSQIIVTDEDGIHTTPHRPQTPRSRRASMESISSDVSYSSSPPSAFSPSPSVRNATNRASRGPRPALNAAMSKRRKKAVDSFMESTPWPPTQFSHKTPTSADELERKISDILTTIPAHIRLTSSNGADARDHRSSRAVSYKGSKGYLRAARSISGLKSPELTLSPVKQDSDSANMLSGRKSAASLRVDNDIRMYHLTQPGKEQPVKLFIRRVGENGERVMVRVGGGWADLGEYLRQYAEHHGRRTASNGQFEILGLELGGSDPTPNRPDSVASKRDRRASGGAQGAPSPMTTPNRPPTRAAVSPNQAPPPVPNFSPRPTSSNENSATPSSSDSSRRSWRGDEVGLAGPKSKKIDLSNERMEWVEGMMKQARSVSGNFVPQSGGTPLPPGERGESRSESRTSVAGHEFGDLGKVGGTKRLYMRNGALHEH